MNFNVFMISDASYYKEQKIAGIAVIDTYSGEKYSTKLINIKSNMEAEFIALVYSVKIAMKKGYKNPVFAYDCQSLVLDNLQEYVKNKFIRAQFLWLKREYVSEADAEAKNVLALARSLQKIKPKQKAKSEKKIRE